MTEEFKEKLLRWLTSNYYEEAQSTTINWGTYGTLLNNLKTELDAELMHGYTVTNTVNAVDINNNSLNYTILYGLYYTDDTHGEYRGYIAILDEYFILKKVIKSYRSGTLFGEFLRLEVGDDGNFFAVERTDETRNRFVLLNNIVAVKPDTSDYEVVLRKAYNLSGSLTTVAPHNLTISRIIKAPAQANYLITSGGTEHAITELIIRVGSPNEWTDFTYPTSIQYRILDAICSWTSNGKITFKTAGYVTNSSNTEYAELNYLTENETHTLTYFQFTGSHQVFLNVTNWNVCICDYDNIYISHIFENKTDIYKIDFNNNAYTFVWEFSPLTKMYNIGKDLFIVGLNIEEENSIDMAHIERSGKRNLIQHNISQEVLQPTLFIVNTVKQFNVYHINCQFDNILAQQDEIYNYMNYNYLNYQNYDSMIPQHMRINADIIHNGERTSNLLFDRNVFNVEVRNNKTRSSMLIPNYFINGVGDIEPIPPDVLQRSVWLYSKTNAILIKNDIDFLKNIYEQLVINLSTTINIEDRSDSSIIINRQEMANSLNISINEGNFTAYYNASISKIITRYEDDTEKEREANYGDFIFSESDRTSCYLSLIIYVPNDKKIKELELRSNNGLYAKINCINLEKNKYYKIEQKIEVI